MIWFQGKSILYADLSYIQLSYKQFVQYNEATRNYKSHFESAMDS